MLAKCFWALAASASCVAAQVKGFNYASNGNNQGTFQADIKAAASLPGASGFNSARLYTMIQDGTANTPTSAIPAAIAAKGTLLLGLWASAGQDAFNNELAALKSAIQQYGQDFADTVVGISVGSEDLYRITYTSQVVNADPNPGAEPDTIVSYISQVRDTIKGTVLGDKLVGHVDTYTAYINGSNQAVIDACDFLGVDAYPYYESTLENSIDNAYSLFFSAYDQTTAVSKGKPVWVTETGWPYSGKTYNLAIASVANAESYWKSVGCALFGKTNVWWYTLSDPGANPAFGVLGDSINNKPVFDLTCDSSSSPPHSSPSSSQSPSSPSSAASPSGSETSESSTALPPPQGPSSESLSAPYGPTSTPSSGEGSPSATGSAVPSGTGSGSSSNSSSSPSSNSSSNSGSNSAPSPSGPTNTPFVAAAIRNAEIGAGAAALLGLLGYIL